MAFTAEDIEDLESAAGGIEDPDPRAEKKRIFRELLAKLRRLRPAILRMSPEQLAQTMQLFDDAERMGCELSLATFFKRAWPHMDTSTYQHNWHIDIIAEEAEKLTTGEFRRLIVNQPPRSSKSTLLAVALPAWIWLQPDKGPMSGPQVQFMFASYGQSLSFNHSTLCRNLILSNWYQHHWGNRFKLKEDRNAVGFFENSKGGYRIATSVGAAVTGFGADFIGVDDPSNTQDVTSEAERQSVINWYSQSLSTRLNNPKTGVILLVQQRQHEEDLTGYLLSNESEMWEHRVFRMRYENNPPLDYDPRSEEGELLWPSRMPEDEVAKLEKTLGSYGASGQLQQRPEPKGGGILKAKDWKLFPPEGQEEEWKKDGVICWPPFEFVLASLDSSYTEKTINDPSALTIWGLWFDRLGAPRIVIVHAWQEHLSFNPLVMRVGNNCRKFKPDVLLVEAKASGISAAQEIQRVFGSGEWSTALITPRGDKVSRALAVQGLFEEGLIFAPDRAWAQDVIDQCSTFPAGKHDDLVDTVTMALRYMRDNGLIKRRDEHKREIYEAIPKAGESYADALPYDV